MGQNTSKFQPPVEAKDKHVGTFQSGIDNKNLKVGEIPVGDDRGSGHVDTQLGLSREPAVGDKSTATPDPEQHERDYFANNFKRSDQYTQQESNYRAKACVIGLSYEKAVDMYPRDARIVASLREARTDFMLIPKQNIMVHGTYEADFQYNGHGQNDALLQDKPIIRCFVKNMEPDVPFELVKIENK